MSPLPDSDAMSARPASTRAALLLVWVGVAFVLGIALARLFFSVETSDESFYAAIPYRFMLGARPFVDELDLHQTAGLLTYPLVRLYVALFSTNGLILALRLAYFLFVCGIGACTVVALRKAVPWRLLACGALAYVALVPLSLPSLSYDTLAAGFLSLGVMLGVCYLFVRPMPALLVLAGGFHALAAASYLSLALIGPAFAIGLWFASGRSVRPTLWYVAGFLSVLCAFAAAMLSFGLTNILQALSFTRSYAMFGGGIQKLHWMASDALRWWLFALPLSLLLVLAVLALRGQRRRQSVCLALLPASGALLLVSGHVSGYPAPKQLATVFVLLFAVFAWLRISTQLGPSHTRSALVFWVLVPCTVAAGITAYTSANGLMSAAFGVAPLVLLAGVVLRPPGADGEEAAASAPWTRWLPIVSAIILGLAFQWMVVYRDAPVTQLTARVSGSAYAGLLTTPERRQKIYDMTRDLEKVAVPGDHVLFWTGFPAGYLLTSLPSYTPSAWLTMSGEDPRLLKWFRRTGKYPSLIVCAHDMASSPPDLGRGRYALVCSRPEYSIFRMSPYTPR